MFGRIILSLPILVVISCAVSIHIIMSCHVISKSSPFTSCHVLSLPISCHTNLFYMLRNFIRLSIIYVCFLSGQVTKETAQLQFEQSAKTFQVIGSMDCAQWTTLLSIQDANFTKYDECRSWLIPVASRRPFSCIGLRLMDSIGTQGYVAVRNIVMWE